MSRVLRPTLIFDCDDTLWPCHEYYVAAREALAADITRVLGLPTETAYALVVAVDGIRKRLEKGFLRPALERSFTAAFRAAYALQAYNDADGNAVRYGKIRAEEVWAAPYTAFDGVPELLQTYREGGWQVVLATKGQDDVQRGKIATNGLEAFVDAIYVAPTKDESFFRGILNERLCEPGRTFVIGDSLESDILPAQAAGARGVHVTGDGESGGVGGTGTRVVEGRAWDTVEQVYDLPFVLPFAVADFAETAGPIVEALA